MNSLSTPSLLLIKAYSHDSGTVSPGHNGDVTPVWAASLSWYTAGAAGSAWGPAAAPPQPAPGPAGSSPGVGVAPTRVGEIAQRAAPPRLQGPNWQAAERRRCSPPAIGGRGGVARAPGAACQVGRGRGAGAHDLMHVAARALRNREPPRAAHLLRGTHPSSNPQPSASMAGCCLPCLQCGRCGACREVCGLLAHVSGSGVVDGGQGMLATCESAAVSYSSACSFFVSQGKIDIGVSHTFFQKLNTRQLFCPLGNSSVVSMISVRLVFCLL